MPGSGDDQDPAIDSEHKYSSSSVSTDPFSLCSTPAYYDTYQAVRKRLPNQSFLSLDLSTFSLIQQPEPSASCGKQSYSRPDGDT